MIAHAYYDADFDDPPGDPIRAAEERKAERYTEAMKDVCLGRGPFWNGWENEQQFALFKAAQMATSAIGLNDGQRWDIIMRVICTEGAKYAAQIAEGDE